MAVTAPPTVDRNQIATRLLKTAAKHSYDPNTTIDWDAPAVPGLFWIPEKQVSLYGTPMWEQMDLAQRIELSKHELASMYSIELWVETVLMHMLVRHVHNVDADTPLAWHMWTEIAEECRHSTMFGRVIATSGCPEYGPGRLLHRLGKLFGAIATPTLMMAGALFFEEYGDTLQRACIDDETLQPIVRTASRIHVIEEARHIKFARDELARRVPHLSLAERVFVQALTGPFVYAVVSSMVHPKAYVNVGLDVTEARTQVATNPHHLQTQQWASQSSVALFTELGLTDPISRVWWRRAHAIA